MNPSRFHTITLGCKLNQFDTAAIEGELTRRGLAPEPDASLAGVVIVNTCTVTHKADAEARRLIRSIRRGNPRCRLLVTGCYAELEPATIAAIPGVDRVFGNRDKPRLSSILDELGITSPATRSSGPVVQLGARGCDGTPLLPGTLHFGDRSRAFLKVQEGCRLRCSYCIIPQVRGNSRSVSPDRLVGAARSLFDSGYREIVLTGVNTGDYGRDLEPSLDLAALLRRLLAICGPNRIRLNSLEPLTISEGIVRLMAGEPRLASHLQVPLQSGDPAILRRMRRNYRLESYLERVSRLRSAIPDIGLGADVIVGFPGETESSFQRTRDFIVASPLNFLHVFSWSPRPGTPAAGYPDRVDGATIRERSARMRRLGRALAFRFRKRFEQRRLDAVVLGPRREDGRLRALTDNFIEVTLEPASARRGDLVRIEMERVTPDESAARVVGRPEWASAPAPS
jgi:threonylcarbamoyladenosine tRNA methylthiotransferase MtaB